MTTWTPSRRHLLRLGVAGAAGLVLAACETSVRRTVWPDITFAHRTPIPLSVNGIEVIDASGMLVVEPPASDIRGAMPVSPLETVRAWSALRLQAAGGYGTAVVSITENRFVEVPLATKQGVEGLFSVDQSERYEGALAVRVEIVGDPSGSGYVQARVGATRTVPEDYSINQREQALYDMLAGMMKNVDERLEQEMRANLSRWILMG